MVLFFLVDIYNSESSEDSKMNINGSPSSPQYTNLLGPNEAKFSQQGGPKTWTQEDMESALDALRTHNMSLTKASVTYGIPSTTLWQRAHRLGIDTPKKEGPTKSWSEDSLNNALDALRTGQISANKASKAYGIPSSTLYKIARREGIRLAAPFNAAPTTWTPDDLERALVAIRTGHTSVQKASTEYGIPTGLFLYFYVSLLLTLLALELFGLYYSLLVIVIMIHSLTNYTSPFQCLVHQGRTVSVIPICSS